MIVVGIETPYNRAGHPDRFLGDPRPLLGAFMIDAETTRHNFVVGVHTWAPDCAPAIDIGHGPIQRLLGVVQPSGAGFAKIGEHSRFARHLAVQPGADRCAALAHRQHARAAADDQQPSQGLLAHIAGAPEPCLAAGRSPCRGR